MSSNRVFCFMLAAALVATFCNESFAQRGSRGPVRRAGKFLGIGWGDGYHKKNPLTDPSYYNPYTHHNSNLHTRGPVSGYGYMGQSSYNPGFGYPSQIQGQAQGQYYTPGNFSHGMAKGFARHAVKAGAIDDAEASDWLDDPSFFRENHHQGTSGASARGGV